MNPDRAGRLDVIGIGPGDPSLCTPETLELLHTATDWVGYTPYLDMAAQLVEPSADQVLHASDNREELARATGALDLAADGRRVAIVSSGDPGVFAMATAVMEALDLAGDERRSELASVDVAIHPGISAAQVAAARVGAPMGHDFAVLSLSTNLKPWSVVERRLDAVGAVDLVVALYNPRSRSRPDDFAEAIEVLRRHRDDDTPVVMARDVGRPAEEIAVVTLGELATDAAAEQVDMRTVVIVGSSRTRITEMPDGTRWTWTPRSYRG